MTTRPGVSEKLAKLRERSTRKKDDPVVEPVLERGKPGKFDSIRWFDKVCADPSLVAEAAAYYDRAVQDGMRYVVPVGNLEELLLQQPGLMFFYQCIAVDASQLRKWFEEKLERLEHQRHNYYMYDDEARDKYGTLKTTDASKLSKADPLVLDMAQNVRIMAECERRLEGLLAAFENMKYVLNNVVTIRKEKLEEVWVDPTRETQNV